MTETLKLEARVTGLHQTAGGRWRAAVQLYAGKERIGGTRTVDVTDEINRQQEQAHG